MTPLIGGPLARAGITILISVGFLTPFARAQVCPTNALNIGSQQYVFPPAAQPYISTVKWFTMARRAPAVYMITNNGVAGAYLGSNPADPTPSLTEMSFRAGGPVGSGTSGDCWPGPTSIGVAESGSGSGRAATGWGGCGGPAEALSVNSPGGQFSYGQRLDPNGKGSSPYPQTIAAALTSSGNYAAYFADTNGTYAVDLTNIQFSYGATPIAPMQTLSTWGGPTMLATLGGSDSGSSDHYLAGIFGGAKTLKIASIGADGKLTPLPATATLSASPGATGLVQATAVYPTGNGYYIFVEVSGGVDVFFFDGTTLSRVGNVPNVSSTDPYTYIAVPVGAPEVVLVAERRSSHSIDVISGGFLAGQAGAPSIATTIAAVSSDLQGGFGAFVAPASPSVLYVYRAVRASAGIGIQTDSFDISCITAPPSPNPTASFTLVDKSAQARADKASYVGDTFAFTDNSQAGSGGAITNWYVWSNYVSSTSNKTNADLSATSPPSLPGIVLPCQILSGGTCSYSPASITGASIGQKFGELVSAGSLDSSAATNAVTLKVPLTRVAGQGSDGSVKILTGGTIDASASDGSPTSFSWSFKDGASAALSTTCAGAKCAPPSNAASFTVAARYAGGYQAATVSGTIVFTDIGGAITVPATIYSSQTSTTATFSLQKGSSVTITGVSYRYDNGTPVAISPVPGLTSSVQIAVPSMTTGQNHTVTFVVAYTGGSLGTSVSFQDTFLFSSVQYTPRVWVSTQASTSATDTCSVGFGGIAGSGTMCSGSPGSFFLSDQGDAGKPAQSATWDFGDGSPIDSSHQTTDFVSHSYQTGTYTLKLTVAGATATQTLTIGQSSPLSASISGPTQVTAGSIATFTANASGGAGGYTYSWTSNDGGSGSTQNFVHTFATSGSFTVSLTVHDSKSASKTASRGVTVGSGGGGGGGGGGCGTSSTAICIAGPSSVAVSTPATWTASVYQTASSSIFIKWSLTGNGLNVTGNSTGFTYTFSAPGTYTLTATGNKSVGSSLIPLTSATATVTVTGATGCGSQCPPISTFSVTGATFNQFVNTYSAKAGDVLAFLADDKGTTTQFAWDFGDDTFGAGAAVTHAFTSGGNYAVKLTAINPYGTNSTPVRFAISGQSFSALIVPGAGHLESVDPPGAYATELSLFNNSNATVTVALDFETADAGSVDPTKLSFPSDGPGFITLGPNQGWSSTDVTAGLLGKGANDLGTIFLKYKGPQPSALARIYFSSGEGMPTYGTYLPVYPINAAGPVLSAQAVGSAPVPVQDIVGLKFNDDYRGGVTVVSASPLGGKFDVSLFRDDGQQVGTTLQESIAGYQQVKLGAAEFGIAQPDPDHIYFATVVPSVGFNAPSIAVGTVTDNRTRDSLLLTDDTAKPSVTSGNATYYVAGAGRYANSKTDLYVLNTSAYPVVLNFSFHYIGDGGLHYDLASSVGATLRTVSPGTALQFTDVVTSLFPDLTDGLSLGELQIDYTIPVDGARLVIQGRNYSDSDAGTYGMQLPAFTAGDGLLPGSPRRIILTGLHNDPVEGSSDYDYISRFGFVALGDGLVTVHADAYDQAGGTAPFWSGDYSLNSAGYGHFIYIPTTGSNAPAEFAGHQAFNMVITVTTGDTTTPAAAFATIQDARSRDLVFIPGKRPSS